MENKYHDMQPLATSTSKRVPWQFQKIQIYPSIKAQVLINWWLIARTKTTTTLYRRNSSDQKLSFQTGTRITYIGSCK